MEHRMRMAANIRRTRKELGWSQETLAYQAGLHSTEISRLERGMREPRLGDGSEGRWKVCVAQY